jgi:site-specific recombinase XerD
MAGHSNVKTTEKYTHLTDKNLLKKMKEMEERRDSENRQSGHSKD